MYPPLRPAWEEEEGTGVVEREGFVEFEADQGVFPFDELRELEPEPTVPGGPGAEVEVEEEEMESLGKR